MQKILTSILGIPIIKMTTKLGKNMEVLMMNKKEILERYKNEGEDEGKENNNRQGDLQGFYALCFLSQFLMFYQVWIKQPFGDVASLMFVFLSVGAFSRYKLEKDKSHLMFGILTGIACLACLGWYIWKTI